MSKIKCCICGSQFETDGAAHMPFCSHKCQQIDLGRWLNEEYSLPVEGQEDREEIESEEDMYLPMESDN